MPAAGRPWRREHAAFKAECKRTNAECWLCRGSKGPIDYNTHRMPLSFSADHITPTSLGGHATRRANLKPAHYGCNSSRGNTTRGQFPTSRKW